MKCSKFFRKINILSILRYTLTYLLTAGPAIDVTCFAVDIGVPGFNQGELAVEATDTASPTGLGVLQEGRVDAPANGLIARPVADAGGVETPALKFTDVVTGFVETETVDVAIADDTVVVVTGTDPDDTTPVAPPLVLTGVDTTLADVNETDEVTDMEVFGCLTADPDETTPGDRSRGALVAAVAMFGCLTDPDDNAVCVELTGLTAAIDTPAEIDLDDTTAVTETGFVTRGVSATLGLSTDAVGAAPGVFNKG